MTRLKRACWFTLVTGGALFVALLPFLCRGASLVWSVDGVVQHATFLQYMFEQGLLFSGGNVFDYGMGLGADAMASMTYYMMYDPINLLLYLLPRGNFFANYSFLVVVKLFISAVAMYFYLGEKVKRFPVRVAVSAAYMLSGYMMHTFLRHPDLASGAMYLPLVILGVERVLDGKRPYLLVCFACLTLIGNFYMFYMTSVFVVIYAVIYYFCRYERRAKPFFKAMFKTAGWYLLAVGLACFVLLPTVYGYISAARSESKGFDFFSLEYLIAIMAGFFVPTISPAFTPLMYTPVTLALVIAAVYLKKAKPAVIASLVMALAVVVPVGGYVFNLFNYVNNRFAYTLTFSVCAAAAYALDSAKFGDKQVRVAVKSVVTFISLFVVVGFWYLGLSGFLSKPWSVVCAVAAVPTTAGFFALLYFFYVRAVKFGRLAARITARRALAAFCVFALAWPLAYTIGYSAEFVQSKDLYRSLYTPDEAYVSSLEGYNRIDYHPADRWINQHSNRPLNNKSLGTASYNTVTPQSLYTFIAENGVFAPLGTLGISGLNGRVALQALAGANYYYTDGYAPYGFQPVDGCEKLYASDKTLPFGTVFDRTMPAAQYASLGPVEKQHAALRYVAAGGGSPVDYTPAVSIEPLGTIEVSGRFEIEGRGKGGETYLGFTADVPRSNGSFSVTNEHFQYSQSVFAKGDQFYTGQTEFLYNLGETDGTIAVSGNVTLKNAYLAYYSFEAFERAVSEPRASLENLTFTRSGFSGTIDSDGGAMLIPLAYSAGFTAFIDGKQAEIVPADSGLMAVNVPAGAHRVELSYRTPWFDAGVTVTVVSIMALIVCAYASYLYSRTDQRKY